MASARYDKATLGPNTGRGSGVRAWMRWAKRHGTQPVKIKNPSKFKNRHGL